MRQAQTSIHFGDWQAAAVHYARERARSSFPTSLKDAVAEIKKGGGEAFFIKADSFSAEDNRMLDGKTYGSLHSRRPADMSGYVINAYSMNSCAVNAVSVPLVFNGSTVRVSRCPSKVQVWLV